MVVYPSGQFDEYQLTVLYRPQAPTEAPGALGFAYPPLRGWSSATASSMCGGYALGGRTDYPLSGGDISLIQQRDGDDFQLMYSTNAGKPFCLISCVIDGLSDFSGHQIHNLSTISKRFPPLASCIP